MTTATIITYPPPPPASDTADGVVLGVRWRGVYDPLATYLTNDAVSYGTGAYISISSSNVGNTPSANPALWSVMLDLSAITWAALISSLPTVLPSTSGQPWNNGGVLSIS